MIFILFLLLLWRIGIGWWCNIIFVVVVVIVFVLGYLRDFGLGCFCNLGMVNAKFTITRICSTSVRLPLWIPCKEEEVFLPFQKREGFVCKFLCEQTNPLCGPFSHSRFWFGGFALHKGRRDYRLVQDLGIIFWLKLVSLEKILKWHFLWVLVSHTPPFSFISTSIFVTWKKEWKLSN